MKNNIPNSNNLYDIYKSELKSLTALNRYIVKNKIDKNYFKNIQQTLKPHKKTIDMLVKELDYLSIRALSFKASAESIKLFHSAIEQYMYIAEDVMKLNKFASKTGKIKIRQLFKNVKLIVKELSYMGKKFPTSQVLMGSTNIKLAATILEDLVKFTEPIEKIPLKVIILNWHRIHRMRWMIKRFNKLIDAASQIPTKKYIQGILNLGLMGVAMKQIGQGISELDKLSLIQLFVLCGKIKLLRIILFGKKNKRGEQKLMGLVAIVANVGKSDLKHMIKSLVVLMLIRQFFISAVAMINSIDSIDRKTLKSISRRVEQWEIVLFGGKSGWWIFKKKKKGLLGLVERVGLIEKKALLWGAINMVAMLVFYKSAGLLIQEVLKISWIKMKIAQRSLNRLNKIIFGVEKKGKKGEYKYMGLAPLMSRLGRYKVEGFLKATANVILMLIFYAASNALIKEIMFFTWAKMKMAQISTNRLYKVLFGEKDKSGKKTKYVGLAQLMSELGGYDPKILLKANANIWLTTAAMFGFHPLLTSMSSLLGLSLLAAPATIILRLTLKNILDVFKIVEKISDEDAMDKVKEVMGGLIEFFNGEIVENFSVKKGFKTIAKLAIIQGATLLMTSILLTAAGAGVLAIVGAMVISTITYTFAALIKGIELLNIDEDSKIQTVTTLITAFITAFAAAKLAETIAPIGAKWKDIMLGALAISSVTMIMVGTFFLISKLSGIVLKKEDSLNSVATLIASFVSAFAAAKLAETVAPLGPKFGDIMLGTLVIAAVTGIILTMFVGIRFALNLLGKEEDNIKKCVDVLISFLTAWATAKLAAALIPIGQNAGAVILGALVISGVMLTLVLTFVILENIKKPNQLMKIAWALMKMALISIAVTAILALGVPFAPFALITMIAILAIASIVWLIGKMAKTMGKGLLALFGLALVMTVMSVPLLIFGLTAMILAVSCGGPDMVLTVVLSLVGFILAMALITVLVGALMSTGLFEMGLVGLALLGVALLVLTLPLMSIAIAMKIISETKLEEGAFKSLMEEIVKGLGVFLENPKVMNPFSLGYIMLCMAPLMGIMVQVSIMARILQYLSSLKIPTEWDAKGKPTAFKKMETSDFVAAGMNAAAILSVASAIFADEQQTITFGDGTTAKIPNLNSDALESLSRSTVRKVWRLKRIVGYVGGMAKTLQRMSLLVVPDEEKGFDDKGNPKAWRQMTTQDFVGASINAATILSFFTALFGESPATLSLADGNTISFNPISQASLENLTLSTKWKMQRLRTIVGCVGDMASTLQGMANLTIDEYDEEGKKKGVRSMTGEDFTNAAIVAANLLTFFTKLWSENDVESGEILGTHYEIRPIKESELENLTRSTKRKMERLGVMISPIADIVRTIIDAANLRIPVYKDGKIVDGKTRAMKSTDFARASFNIQRMIRLTLSWIGNIDEDLLDAADDKADDLKDVLEAITGVLGSTTSMITNNTKKLDEIENLFDSKGGLKITNIVNTFLKDMVDQVPSQWKNNATAIEDVMKAVSGVDVLCKKIAEGTNILPDKNVLFIDKDHRTKVSATIESYTKAIFNNIDGKGMMKAKAFADVAKSSNSLLEKINKTDASKLKTAYHLVHDLAKFSQSIQGNFDKLADTINEKLIDALEKLKEVLEDTNEALDKKGNGLGFNVDSVVDTRIIDNTSDKSTTKPDKNAVDNILNKKKKDKTDDLIAEIQSLVTKIKNGMPVKPADNTVWMIKEKTP